MDINALSEEEHISRELLDELEWLVEQEEFAKVDFHFNASHSTAAAA